MPDPRVSKKWCVVIVLYLFLAAPLGAKKAPKATSPKPAVNVSAVSFDSARDPAKDLQDAVAEATRTKKRILLEIGGDWSVYCNLMDLAFDSHPQLRKVRDGNYVTVKVHYSKDHPNEAFLSRYPAVPDYPHFFVLDSKGTLLFSQPTRKFEHGKRYNAGKIEEFLKKWSHPPTHLLHSVG